MKKAKATAKPLATAKSKMAAQASVAAKPKAKASVIKALETEQDADREAVLDEREKLSRQFPTRYNADIAIFPGDKVEVMLRLTYSEAESLARLLKENKL